MKEFLKGLTKSLFVRALGAFSTIGVTSVLARVVGVKFLGMYTFSIMITEAVIMCSHFGVGPRIIKEFGKLQTGNTVQDDYYKLSRKALARSIPFTLIAIVGLLIVSHYSSSTHYYTWEMSVVLIAVPLVGRDILTSYYLNATGKVWQSLVARNVGYSVVFLTMISLAAIAWEDVNPWYIVVLYLFVRYFVSQSFRKLFTINRTAIGNFPMKSWKVNLSPFAHESQKWFFLSQMLNFFGRNSIFLFLGFLGSFDEVGVMIVLVRIGLPIEVLYTIVQKQSLTYISSFIANGDRIGIKRLLYRVGTLGLMFSLIYGFGVFVFFDELLGIFELSAGSDYSFIFSLILLAFTVNAITSVAAPVLQIGGLERHMFIIGLCTLFIQLILYITYLTFDTGLFGIGLVLIVGISFKALLEFFFAIKFILYDDIR